MPNRLLLNDLLYIDEHLTCNNYKRNVDIGFFYKVFEAGDVLTDESINHNYLIAISQGHISARYDRFGDASIKAGEMVLVPRGAHVTCKVHEKTRFIAMAFDNPMSGCDKLVFSELRKLNDNKEVHIYNLPIRKPLDDFFNLLTYCLREQINCAHFHEIKHRELFIYLKGFYTKEELSQFFNPILSTKFSFRDFILRNCDTVNTVNELIEKSHMTSRTFQRHFMEEFGVSAKSWLNKRIANKIISEVGSSDVSIKDLMFKFGFDTPSNFTRFCKTQLDCTPSELLLKSKSR